ncbi:MAG: tRNA (adenosine(37)-N6)-threonylcarbamoyltransferase complex ATPase subunit type 1 TsaE [Chloroflexota bacterium]|nr:tRNA (adenosine(37)-N6)-threonylcarbamoyltransferase complex ATPase subunit type 1 TsaE [Chloroflexota bacterium]
MTPDDIIAIPDARAMQAFGRSFASQLGCGDVVLLHGDLGAGKTTLTQGIAAGLGVAGPVQSPTFSIVAEHDGVDAGGGAIRLYHLDLYRLSDSGDLEALGYDQYIAPLDGISVIEWPERAGAWLPERFWLLRITHSGTGGRWIELSRHEPGPVSMQSSSLKPSNRPW